jgi:hypothetical protein
MIVIHPTEGLCNKLRVVFSYYQKACEINEELIVIWDVTHQCNGYFLDYFEPVENIKFFKNNDAGFTIDYRGHSWCEGYSPYTKKHKSNIYEKLVPLPYLRKAIDERRAILQDEYIAIHIRRTDHSELANQNERYTQDIEFHQFIDENKNHKVYLSTDNYETQKAILEHYPERVEYIKLINKDNHGVTGFSGLMSLKNLVRRKTGVEDSLRKTSLEDAIIDLYMCIYAEKFMGSGYSSFSNFISYIREYGRSVTNEGRM